jgi:hypothetical protein
MARRKVIEWLIHRLEHEVDDDHFVMELWLQRRSDGESIWYCNERNIPHCKTAGCIAGTLFLGLPKKIRKAYTKLDDIWGDHGAPAANVEFAAREQLGLSAHEADNLFAPSTSSLRNIKRWHAVATLKRMLTHSEINWAEANPTLPWYSWYKPVPITITDD